MAETNHGGTRSGAGRPAGTKNKTKLQQANVILHKASKKSPVDSCSEVTRKPMGRPRKYSDPKELWNKCSGYISYCRANERVPSRWELLSALDICPDTFVTMMRTEGEIGDICQRTIVEIVAITESTSLNNPYLTSGCIHALKSLDGGNGKGSNLNLEVVPEETNKSLWQMKHEDRLSHLK